MFGLFKTYDEKQAEFEATIYNSRGWCRNFHGFSAEYKTLRIDILPLREPGPVSFENWEIIVYHFERPSKILFMVSSRHYGRRIFSALRETHDFCFRNYQAWRDRRGLKVYTGPLEKDRFHILQK